MQDKKQENKILLAYWNVVGICNPIRFLLEILEYPYDEKRYTEKEMEEWFVKDKPILKSNFPNLPYLDDNGFIVTESQSIMRYIIEKADRLEFLGGSDIKQKSLVNTQLSSAHEILIKIVQLAYNDHYDDIKDTYFEENLKEKVEKFSKQLGSQKFLNGENVNVSDIMFYDQVIKLMLMFPNDMAKYENILNYKKTFEEIPQIQKYRSSDRYIKAPFFASFAKWNIQPEEYNI